MTRMFRTSFITIASVTALAGAALFSQANAANTSSAQCTTLKCCASLTKDETGCRERLIRAKKQRHLTELIKDEGGGGRGEGGRGGRK